MRSTFTVFASAVEASIKGYATRKLRCAWAINKRGWKAYTTFISRQNAACSNILFFICWVDYALEGSTFSLSKYDFLSCAHYFQGTATQASSTSKAREKRPGDEVAFSLLEKDSAQSKSRQAQVELLGWTTFLVKPYFRVRASVSSAWLLGLGSKL